MTYGSAVPSARWYRSVFWEFGQPVSVKNEGSSRSGKKKTKPKPRVRLGVFFLPAGRCGAGRCGAGRRSLSVVLHVRAGSRRGGGRSRSDPGGARGPPAAFGFILVGEGARRVAGPAMWVSMCLYVVCPEVCAGETSNASWILCDSCRILLDFLVFCT